MEKPLQVEPLALSGSMGEIQKQLIFIQDTNFQGLGGVIGSFPFMP